jgi:hypothetical protein
MTGKQNGKMGIPSSVVAVRHLGKKFPSFLEQIGGKRMEARKTENQKPQSSGEISFR